MFFSDWIFFHCIKKDRITPYKCKELCTKDITQIPIPDLQSNEHIIVLCSYTPKYLQSFFVTKKLKDRIKIDFII